MFLPRFLRYWLLVVAASAQASLNLTIEASVDDDRNVALQNASFQLNNEAKAPLLSGAGSVHDAPGDIPGKPRPQGGWFAGLNFEWVSELKHVVNYTHYYLLSLTIHDNSYHLHWAQAYHWQWQAIAVLTLVNLDIPLFNRMDEARSWYRVTFGQHLLVEPLQDMNSESQGAGSNNQQATSTVSSDLSGSPPALAGHQNYHYQPSLERGGSGGTAPQGHTWHHQQRCYGQSCNGQGCRFCNCAQCLDSQQSHPEQNPSSASQNWVCSTTTDSGVLSSGSCTTVSANIEPASPDINRETSQTDSNQLPMDRLPPTPPTSRESSPPQGQQLDSEPHQETVTAVSAVTPVNTQGQTEKESSPLSERELVPLTAATAATGKATSALAASIASLDVLKTRLEQLQRLKQFTPSEAHVRKLLHQTRPLILNAKTQQDQQQIAFLQFQQAMLYTLKNNHETGDHVLAARLLQNAYDTSPETVQKQMELAETLFFLADEQNAPTESMLDILWQHQEGSVMACVKLLQIHWGQYPGFNIPCHPMAIFQCLLATEKVLTQNLLPEALITDPTSLSFACGEPVFSDLLKEKGDTLRIAQLVWFPMDKYLRFSRGEDKVVDVGAKTAFNEVDLEALYKIAMMLIVICEYPGLTREGIISKIPYRRMIKLLDLRINAVQHHLARLPKKTTYNPTFSDAVRMVLLGLCHEKALHKQPNIRTSISYYSLAAKYPAFRHLYANAILLSVRLCDFDQALELANLFINATKESQHAEQYEFLDKLLTGILNAKEKDRKTLESWTSPRAQKTSPKKSKKTSTDSKSMTAESAIASGDESAPQDFGQTGATSASSSALEKAFNAFYSQLRSARARYDLPLVADVINRALKNQKLMKRGRHRVHLEAASFHLELLMFNEHVPLTRATTPASAADLAETTKHHAVTAFNLRTGLAVNSNISPEKMREALTAYLEKNPSLPQVERKALHRAISQLGHVYSEMAQHSYPSQLGDKARKFFNLRCLLNPEAKAARWEQNVDTRVRLIPQDQFRRLQFLLEDR